METPTIAVRTIDCGRSLARLCGILIKGECKYADQVRLPVVEDILGRFKIWAANVGAHRSGRLSLDYRLREARYMREGVCELLDDLKGILERGYSILSGKQTPYDEETFDSDSSDSAPEGDTTNLGQPRTELQEILHSVQEIISHLYDLALYFRRPAPSDRLSKLAKIDVSHFNEWDQRHVKEKFPRASPDLLQRLGKANSKRRQMFKYHEKHHAKLARNLDITIPATPQPKADDHTASDKVTSREIATTGPARLATTVATTTSTSVVTADTQTTIATFVDTGEVITDDNLSETSSAASEGPDEESTLHLPSLPRGATYGEAFQCPYCYEMLKISGGRSWRIHVLRDLRPYVCTFNNCSFPDRTFGTRREWFDHEAEMHRGEWYCSGCSIKFSSKANFENHMRLEHRNLFADNQLPALAEICARPMDKRATGACPLCLKDGQILRSHLARHMRTLALFVLPRTSDEDDFVPGSNGAQILGSESGASSFSLSQSDRMSEVSAEASKNAPDLDPDRQIPATSNPHQLCWAAGLGDVDLVRALLQVDGLNPNLKDNSDRNPLAMAALNGHESVVRVLLEHKDIDPNAKSDGGRTPLMFAVENGYEAVVRALLDHGAVDPDSMDFSFRTPLVAAIDNGNEAMVRVILEDGRTNPNLTNRTLQSPLSYAAEGGKEAMARVLLDYKKVNPNAMNSKHQTPLLFSAENNNESLVRAILKNERVNPNLMNRIYQTPLVIAAGNGSDSVVKALLEHQETDPNLRDPNNKTSLMLAVENGHTEVIRSLLNHPKTNPNSSIDGQTALMLAVQAGNLDAIRALLEYDKVDINMRNHAQGLTALAYAAQSGRLDVAKLLLARGDADADIKDKEGHTARWWASQGGHTEVEQLLAPHFSIPGLRAPEFR